MVKYNNGRFMFRFDAPTKKLCAVFDTKYDADYVINHPAFETVFKSAVDSLSTEALNELRVRLIDEPKYAKIVSDCIYERNNK